MILLLEGSVAKDGGATFGKDEIPKLGDPPYDGEDDAFADQDAEHVSGNEPTILSRVEELVGFWGVKSAQTRPGENGWEN